MTSFMASLNFCHSRVQKELSTKSLYRDLIAMPALFLYLIATVAFAAGEFLAQGLISEDQKDAIVAQAAESSCGAGEPDRLSSLWATRK